MIVYIIFSDFRIKINPKIEHHLNAIVLISRTQNMYFAFPYYFEQNTRQIVPPHM